MSGRQGPHQIRKRKGLGIADGAEDPTSGTIPNVNHGRDVAPGVEGLRETVVGEAHIDEDAVRPRLTGHPKLEWLKVLERDGLAIDDQRREIRVWAPGHLNSSLLALVPDAEPQEAIVIPENASTQTA